MKEIDNINHKIWELWRDNRTKTGCRVPKFVVPPKKTDTLLFLGLNPSFPKLKKQDKERIENKTGLKYPDDFKWKSSPLARKFNLGVVNNHALVHDTDARWNYSWFRRLNCLACYLKVEINDYGHIDLYLWMDANSREIQKRLKNFTYKDFIERQKKLTMHLLAIHKPRMIVCVYRSAWEHFFEFYSDCLVGEIREHELKGKKGVAVLKYAEVKIDDVNNSVIVIGCPNLPRGYGKKSIRTEHLEKFFDFANKRYNRRQDFVANK